MMARHVLVARLQHIAFALMPLFATLACASAVLAKMEPVTARRQEVNYRNGTPIVTSTADHSIVAVAPVTGPSGRYNVERRLGFTVALRNLSDDRIDVSENDVSIRVNGNLARIVAATEMEDEIRSQSKWARSMSTFDAAMDSMEGIRRSVVRAEASAREHAIRRNETERLGGVAKMLQRNTLEPGDWVSGLVVVEPQRDSACRAQKPELRARLLPIPCEFEVVIRLAGDVHSVSLKEILPPAALPTRPVLRSCEQDTDCDVLARCVEGLCRQ